MSSGLIVFDLDNTVVHSRIDFVGIRRELIALLRADRLIDEGDEAIARRSIGQIIDIAGAHQTSLAERCWEIVLEYEKAGMAIATVEDGAWSALAGLRRLGFGLAMLTNNARAATVEALDRFELTEHFALVLTRDEVAMKPDPAGLTVARERLSANGRMAMVGDSWLDGTAADRARAPFIAFRPRPGVLQERNVPVWTTVDNLGAIALVVAGDWPADLD